MPFIKVLGKKSERALYAHGFSYVMSERCGRSMFYIFVLTPDLEQLLSSQFSNITVVREDKLRF